MKLLHTSDWHLGAKLGRHDRHGDHLAAIRQLLEIAQTAEPDLIIHSGDLFDATRPPYPSLQLAVRSLRRLSQIAPTLVLSGNHDSRELLRVIDELAGGESPRRLRLVTAPEVVSYPDEEAGNPPIGNERVAVACVPFIPHSAIVDYASTKHERFEGEYADGIRTLNRRLLDEAERGVAEGSPEAGSTESTEGIVLYAAHLHLHGARPGNSERRLTVGDDYAAHPQGLHRALYCAFGHIHDPQLIPGGTANGRYAGSLVPLDFGESSQAKQTVLVTISDAGVEVETEDLPPGRPLVAFAGDLAQLEARAADGGLNDCILKAHVRSDDPIPDLADRLEDGSPDCAVFGLVNEVANRRAKAISSDDEDQVEPTMAELFAEWRQTAATRGQTEAPLKDVLALFAKAVDGTSEDGAAAFGAAELAIRARTTLDSLSGKRRPGVQGDPGIQTGPESQTDPTETAQTGQTGRTEE